MLLAFSLRSWSRCAAWRASSVTFIAYASTAHLLPVLVLHAALLPINLWRLGQFFSSRTRARRLMNRPVHDLERKRS